MSEEKTKLSPGDVYGSLHAALSDLLAAKPSDRNDPASRAYQICITDLEKLMAYFDVHVMRLPR